MAIAALPIGLCKGYNSDTSSLTIPLCGVQDIHIYTDIYCEVRHRCCSSVKSVFSLSYYEISIPSYIRRFQLTLYLPIKNTLYRNTAGIRFSELVCSTCETGQLQVNEDRSPIYRSSLVLLTNFLLQAIYNFSIVRT